MAKFSKNKGGFRALSCDVDDESGAQARVDNLFEQLEELDKDWDVEPVPEARQPVSL